MCVLGSKESNISLIFCPVPSMPQVLSLKRMLYNRFNFRGRSRQNETFVCLFLSTSGQNPLNKRDPFTPQFMSLSFFPRTLNQLLTLNVKLFLVLLCLLKDRHGLSSGSHMYKPPFSFKFCVKHTHNTFLNIKHMQRTLPLHLAFAHVTHSAS